MNLRIDGPYVDDNGAKLADFRAACARVAAAVAGGKSTRERAREHLLDLAGKHGVSPDAADLVINVTLESVATTALHAQNGANSGNRAKANGPDPYADAEHDGRDPAREPTPTPPRIGDTFAASIDRAERRSAGKEKPIPLPWRILEPHFGGGLWPGLHVVNAGTGIGKTQGGLQIGTGAAKAKIPVLYIGLELGELELALRMLGEEARVPWSTLWTGQAGPAYLERVRAAVPALKDLPFHYEVARPHGFAASEIRSAIERVRSLYPETDGPGSRPMLVVVDFLQLVGEEIGEEIRRQDLRERIGRAAYVCRDAANRLNVSVLCISSIARERYTLMDQIGAGQGLAFDVDDDDRPIKRRILNSDVIVGAGKESGEIEYSADSVSVIAKVAGTWSGDGCDVVFATPKGRATGATWSPLHFTGFRYEECVDGGAQMIDAWKAAGEQRERKREEKRTAKEEAVAAKIAADSRAIRTYVAAHPGCTVSAARVHAVGDASRRWAAAVELLGAELVQTKTSSKVSLTLTNGGAHV